MTRRKRRGKDASAEQRILVGNNVSVAARRIFAGLRVQRQFTQRAVADRLGKRPSWTNLLENGHYAIKLQDFLDLCALYNADPVDVIADIVDWKPMK